LDERGVGAAVVAAIIVIIIAVAVGGAYVATRGRVGYPQMSVSASVGRSSNEIWIYVLSLSSIPSGEWAYSVSATMGSYSWVAGAEPLDAPSVSLGTYAAGTWYVSLKHVPSGHVYFADKLVTISGAG
jgi:hypothetical protein